jgi:hypothetical protein
MPKEAHGEDAIIVATLTDVMERTIDNAVPGCPVAATGFSRMEFEQSALNNTPSISEKEMEALHERWIQLRDIARRQTFGVLNAINVFLTDQGLEKTEIADILLNVGHIGRQFGRLPEANASHEDGLCDAELITNIKYEPEEWLCFDIEQRRVDFSTQAKEMLKKSYAKHLGCTVLGTSAKSGGKTVNMYDQYWDFFAENYVGVFVVGDLSYKDAKPYI